MWQKFINGYDEIAGALSRIRTFDLVAFFTAYTLFRISHNPIDMALAVCSAVLVCRTNVRNSGWFWLAIVVAWLPRMIWNWYRYEDHCFLVIYWCAAISISLFWTNQRMVLRRSARLLIGLCLAVGFVWKIISPEFYDGSLFHFKLLFDYRFAEIVTEPFGGMHSATTAANLNSYSELRSFDRSVESVSIDFPVRVSWIAHSMTIWTILIEGILAAAFLLPSSRLTSRWRDWLLIVFMLSTYFVVPVMGFACLLSTMGIAQTRSQRARLAYVLTSLALFLWYSVRWQIL